MGRSVVNDTLLGLMAGATGTVALDTATYVDMALRGRASSETPAYVAGAIASKLGAHTSAITGQSSQAQSRRSGMGALLGYATGCSLGVAYGLARPWLGKSTPLLSGLALGALAMVAADTPAITLHQTNPRSWGASGWLADIAPHLVYGFATVYTFEALWTRSASVASQKAVAEGDTPSHNVSSKLASNIRSSMTRGHGRNTAMNVRNARAPKRRAIRWPAIFVAARNTTR